MENGGIKLAAQACNLNDRYNSLNQTHPKNYVVHHLNKKKEWKKEVAQLQFNCHEVDEMYFLFQFVFWDFTIRGRNYFSTTFKNSVPEKLKALY